MERTAKIIFSLVLLLRIAYLNQPIPANAASWIGIGPDGGQVLAIAIDPVTPQTVYAATGGGVYKSTNSGQNWQPAYTGIAGIDVTTISALAIDPGTPQTVYAASPEGGVYKSTDGGNSWNLSDSGITTRHMTSLAIDPLTPQTIYAGTWGNVYKSTYTRA